MNKFFAAFAVVFATAAVASADVIYTYVDLERDETFDVYAEIVGETTTGLATYNIALSGLDGVELDPATFVWTEGVLATTDASTGLAVGFTSGLLASPVGTDAYSATNSQFNNANFLTDVGMAPVFVEGLVFPPLFDEPTIDLDVPALLGQLTIPGANNYLDEELEALFSSSAALFNGSSPTDVSEPAGAIVNDVIRIPEPSSVALIGLAVAGFAARRRK